MLLERSNGERTSKSGSAKLGSVPCNVSRIIRAIQESTSPKLSSINTLLQAVVQLARVVVKGTNSQQQFNAQFSEFCRAALVGIADLEVAVHMLEKTDGLIQQDTHAEEDVKGIRVTDFVKEVAVFVASQTNVLGAQYLEHVGMSAIAKVSKTQTAVAGKKRGAKRENTDETKQRYFAGGSPPLKRAGTLTPIDHNTKLDVLPRRFIRGADDVAVAHNRTTKLSNMAELSTWVQPWTLPLPAAHGVALDRVTTERQRPPSGLDELSKSLDDVLLLDLCTASTAAEVSRLCEAREYFFHTGVDRSAGCNATVLGATGSAAAEKGSFLFFPKNSFEVVSSVPTHAMVDLVHYGVSFFEMPFKDVV